MPFLTDPTSTFWAPKTDLKPIPSGSDVTRWWIAVHANQVRTALFDLRDGTNLSLATGTLLSSTWFPASASFSSSIAALSASLSSTRTTALATSASWFPASASLNAQIVSLSSTLHATVVDEQAVSSTLVSLQSYVNEVVPPLSQTVVDLSQTIANLPQIQSGTFVNVAPADSGTFFVYVRTTGSDGGGSGAPGNPFRTLKKALSTIPAFTGQRRYFIDITGIEEEMPAGYVIPWTFGTTARMDTFTNDPDAPTEFNLISSVKEAVNILAYPKVLVTGVIITPSTATFPTKPDNTNVIVRHDIISGPLPRNVVAALTGAWVTYGGLGGDAAYGLMVVGVDFVNGLYLDIVGNPGFTTVDLVAPGATLYNTGTMPAGADESVAGVINVNSPSRLSFVGINMVYGLDGSVTVANVRQALSCWFEHCSFMTDPRKNFDPSDVTGTFFNFWNQRTRTRVNRAHSSFVNSFTAGVRVGGFGYGDIYQCYNRIGDIEIQNEFNQNGDIMMGGPGHLDIQNLILYNVPDPSIGGSSVQTTGIRILSDKDEGSMAGSSIKMLNCWQATSPDTNGGTNPNTNPITAESPGCVVQAYNSLFDRATISWGTNPCPGTAIILNNSTYSSASRNDTYQVNGEGTTLGIHVTDVTFLDNYPSLALPDGVTIVSASQFVGSGSSDFTDARVWVKGP